MSDEKIIDLEIRYTHQARLLEELSEVLNEQRVTIQQLERRVVELEKKLREAAVDPTGGGDEGPPPHY